MTPGKVHNPVPSVGNDKLYRSLQALLAVMLIAVAPSFAAGIPATDGEVAGATVQQDRRTGDGAVDPRWLPWLGCWELLSGGFGERELADSDAAQVCLTPDRDRRGVAMTISAHGVPVIEETLVADGARRWVERQGCRSERSARWSQDGRRLFVASEVECEDGVQRFVSGLRLHVAGGDWVDVELWSSDGLRKLFIRRFRRIGAESSAQLNSEPSSSDPVTEAVAAGLANAQSLSIEQVIEASRNAEPEVVEAALLESRARFEIDAAALLALAEAEVPTGIIDLMVALSFPDRFTVEWEGSIAMQVGEPPPSAVAGTMAMFYPFYAHPCFFGYCYWDGWWYWHWNDPYPPGVTPPAPPSPHGQVIQGLGYTRVRTRATPRQGSERGSSSGSRRARFTGGSSSSADGGVTSSGGYSRTGSAARTAKPRNE